MQLFQIVLALLVVAVATWLINTRARMRGNIARFLNTVLALLVVGMALWLINAYVPMAGSINAILNITVVVATCVRVLQAFDLWNPVVRLWRSLITRHPPRSQVG
jgi:predicted membrane protein